jgi:NADH-quinone oxidoreductase subunit L
MGRILAERPGLLFVLATLLPLCAFTWIWILGFVYRLRGKRLPQQLTGIFSTLGMAVATIASITGLVIILGDYALEGIDRPNFETRWSDSVVWAKLAPEQAISASTMTLGYRIDLLSAFMITMVTFVGTCIFTFSLGYMKEERDELVHDNPIIRPGRFARFYLYLNLFCFSMLNLLIADNLFQIFFSWELVGVCSFFLIGFYIEKTSAGAAANKAFIINRVGDAGFLVGLGIIWTAFGTFDFNKIEAQLRCPARDTHGTAVKPDQVGQIFRAERDAKDRDFMQIQPDGSQVLLFPDHWHAADIRKQGHVVSSEVIPPDSDEDFHVLSYSLLTIAGLGIFLGCVGKSAQFPLQTWLPDAMEGPTPVSALIHAATMVAAGVYLVARAFPLFTPEVLLVIAYTGAVTLFIAATIATVQTDIKKILAYSTVSQLGYMMLALGCGGWVAGLLHLLTHAFFKALLFLGSGSVIHGCHHEQDIRKMGGLFKKMPITAVTMLIGVLAIIGTPFFSGWYSKDLVLGQAFGFAKEHPEHALLAILPFLTAILTAYYMFRLWFLTFLGTARDHHVEEHAHESPRVMTIPLILLAIFSLGVAWGWPFWDANASWLGNRLFQVQPDPVALQFEAVEHAAHDSHLLVGFLALGCAIFGVAIAFVRFGNKSITADSMGVRKPGIGKFLDQKSYFDELYQWLFVQPIKFLGKFFARFDKQIAVADDRITPGSLDGIGNTIGLGIAWIANQIRRIQTGNLRMYLLVLAVTMTMVMMLL